LQGYVMRYYENEKEGRTGTTGGDIKNKLN
jgi:hypothetical protein